MTSMLRGGKMHDGYTGLQNGGCSCCNSRADHRKAKHAEKRKEARDWKQDWEIR